LRAGAPVIEHETDRKINVEENCNQQGNAHDPKEWAEIAKMLGVIIDPTRSQENLQISKEMPDDEEHQNDAGKGDDHFLTNGRAIKRGESSHEGSTLSFFALAFNHVPASEHRLFSLCAQRSFTPL
jgi:hypothetical protein